jgi:hypothetical protein
MHILRHATEVSAYIAAQPQGVISTLIEQRLQELLADGLDRMEELVGHFDRATFSFLSQLGNQHLNLVPSYIGWYPVQCEQ